MADPTAANEQKHPALNLTAEERRLYEQVLQAADKEGLGVVTGDVAIAFFPQRTKLPVDVLGEIWQIADTEDKGFLTPNGFYIVLRLIGYAQAGRPVNAQAATKPGPLPRFDGVNAPAVGALPAAATTLQPQGSGGPIRVPPLMPDKASQYSALFEQSGAQGGLLPGATAKQIFDRAQLPNDVLVRIWNLADTEMRGMLSCTEFIIAMHLLASFRSGAMRALPQTLPAGLYEAAARRGRPTSGARPSPGSPTASAIPRQLTGGAARNGNPLVQHQPYTAPPVPTTVMAQVQGQAADGWAISLGEKTKYDNQFARLDPSGKGFVSGEEAVGFFSNSGLSENDLAQIWDLSDINSEGKLSKDEFAVAMHLILQRVQTKAAIPTTLPANLIPPSMRSSERTPNKSTAPDFQPQTPVASKQVQSAAEDLFGLDALSGPPAPVAAPQVAQSTGGSSSFATPSSQRGPASPVPAAKPGPGTIFKPFQPSSTFGQSMVSPQPTGASASSQPRSVPVPNDDLLGDNDEASRNLNSDAVELGNLSNQVNTLTNQVQDVRTKRGTTEGNLEHAAAQKREFELRLIQLRQSYEQEAQEVHALEEKVATVRSENAKLQQDIAMVQHTQQGLTEQHQQITGQYAADQQENIMLKERISQLNNEVNQLKPQVEKARSEARQQKGLVAINKKQLTTVEVERDRLKSELDQATRENADATKELTIIQSKMEVLTQEKDKHIRDVEATRQRNITSSKQREDARSLLESAQQPALANSPPNAASPAASVNNMNPFFKRSITGTSDRNMAASPAAPSITSPNHSAFDDFFGPSLASGSTATPRSPAAIGTFAPPAADPPASAEVAIVRNATLSPTNEPRPAVRSLDSTGKIPPSPPRSRQISSSILPLRNDTSKPSSDSSSVGVAAPPSRYEGSSGFATPNEKQASASESSRLHHIMVAEPSEGNQAIDSEQQNRPDLASAPSTQAKELPGTFPDETPFQTPDHTGSTDGNTASFLAPQGTSIDPFASKPRTPVSAVDGFDPAFTDFGEKAKGKGPEGLPGKNFPTTSAPPASTGQSEFPPIQHFDNEQSDSDSDTDSGFQDSVPPAPNDPQAQSIGRPTMHRGPSTMQELPPITAQNSPPSYDKTVGREDDGRDSNQFPAEFQGLLPSREDPTSHSQSPNSVPESENAIQSPADEPVHHIEPNGFFGGASARDRALFGKHAAPSQMPIPSGEASSATFSYSNQSQAPSPGRPTQTSGAQSTGFDDFDDDFNDLAEAQAADDNGAADDLARSIASRRDTLDEFNPTFDSPAPSTRATTTFSDPHASVGGSAVADFESSMHSGGTGAGVSSVGFGSASQAASSNHDWDAMFAGLDGTGAKSQTNGSSAVDEAFGAAPSSHSPGSAAPADKPSLARAISVGTEHDDPILKRLTGMGFSRDDSLQALERFDYNIDKAADYLTSQV